MSGKHKSILSVMSLDVRNFEQVGVEEKQALCIIRAVCVLHANSHLRLPGKYLNDATLWKSAPKRNVQCQSSRWNAFSADRAISACCIHAAENTQIG